MKAQRLVKISTFLWVMMMSFWFVCTFYGEILDMVKDTSLIWGILLVVAVVIIVISSIACLITQKPVKISPVRIIIFFISIIAVSTVFCNIENIWYEFVDTPVFYITLGYSISPIIYLASKLN